MSTLLSFGRMISRGPVRLRVSYLCAGSFVLSLVTRAQLTRYNLTSVPAMPDSAVRHPTSDLTGVHHEPNSCHPDPGERTPGQVGRRGLLADHRRAGRAAVRQADERREERRVVLAAGQGRVHPGGEPPVEDPAP